jgi:hypothetical protein
MTVASFFRWHAADVDNLHVERNPLVGASYLEIKDIQLNMQAVPSMSKRRATN